MPEAKVTKKKKKTAVKRTSLKDLEGQIKSLAETVEVLVKAQTAQVKTVEPKKPEPEPPKRERVPLEEGTTYIFCSGPHKGQQLRITPGRRSDFNPLTGEYTLIPPEIVDFGAIDEGTGPAGYHVTKDLEEVEKIRNALDQVKTQEITEVTGDPAFEHIVQMFQ
jgi:hypothetical protein